MPLLQFGSDGKERAWRVGEDLDYTAKGVSKFGAISLQLLSRILFQHQVKDVVFWISYIWLLLWFEMRGSFLISAAWRRFSGFISSWRFDSLHGRASLAPIRLRRQSCKEWVLSPVSWGTFSQRVASHIWSMSWECFLTSCESIFITPSVRLKIL